MIESIEEMLKRGETVGVDSILFPSGKLVILEVGFYGPGLNFVGPIVDGTFESYLSYNADDLVPIDVFNSCSNLNLLVQVGDGAAERNGFIMCRTKSGDLKWIAFFENSGAFESVEIVDDVEIHAKSEDGSIWKIQVSDPLNITIKS